MTDRVSTGPQLFRVSDGEHGSGRPDYCNVSISAARQDGDSWYCVSFGNGRISTAELEALGKWALEAVKLRRQGQRNDVLPTLEVYKPTISEAYVALADYLEHAGRGDLIGQICLSPKPKSEQLWNAKVVA